MSWPRGQPTRDNRRALVAVLAGALLIPTTALALTQERPVDLEIVLAVDASASVSDEYPVA